MFWKVMMMIKNIINMNIKMIIIIINLILYILYNNNKLIYAKLNKRLDYKKDINLCFLPFFYVFIQKKSIYFIKYIISSLIILIINKLFFIF